MFERLNLVHRQITGQKVVGIQVVRIKNEFGF